MYDKAGFTIPLSIWAKKTVYAISIELATLKTNERGPSLTVSLLGYAGAFMKTRIRQ